MPQMCNFEICFQRIFEGDFRKILRGINEDYLKEFKHLFQRTEL